MNDPARQTVRHRRDFLRTGVGLGLAGVVGAAGAARRAQDAPPWRAEELHALPENRPWTVVDAHDTGHVLPGWRRKTANLDHRIAFDRAPDGRRSFCHVVRTGDVVDPVGIDSARIPANFATFSRVLMRYHHWIEEHSGRDGKWIGLQLGRGWVGRGYVQYLNEEFGADGGSATTMHPAREGGNGIRLLASHAKQVNPYGHLVGDGRDPLPRGRWLTVDVVIDRDEGHRLYVDGEQIARSAGVRPVRQWELCNAIWYRTRLMHGGTPSLLPALNDYREWFGGFFVAVA